MKRYGQLTVILAIIVLTIGTFYIQSAIASNGLPGITMEKVKGNKDEIKPVTISGSYSVGNSRDEFVQIDSKGATYGGKVSFPEHFRDRFFNAKVNQLQETYRSFMRGKGGSDTSYLETEDTLAYADVINQTVPGRGEATFDIAVLDKESDETMSFTLPVPNRAMYVQVQVQDVQMTGDELHVITRNYPQNGEKEAHFYRIDISNKAITGEDTIVSDGLHENKHTLSNMVSVSDETTAYDNIIFSKTTRPVAREDSQGMASEQTTKEKSEGYIVYNPETGKKRSLKMPESLEGQGRLGRDNTSLYFSGQQQIIEYNVETEQITNEVDLPSSCKEAKWGGITRIANDRAYMLAKAPQSFKRLLVLDLKSGDTLFEGKVKLEGSPEQNDKLNLYELRVD
ncbi:hypothetical protein GCM10007063_09650 [Lentibacillus kapialis]|uniref:Uncharacterized protein n=1 Tax=Lentibacillus kapialis TaxID=340214 RepID=A0A917PRB8_9BACI|nr:hypothetical protein [Lentibacillus kapialis]GGJ89075.1 hypothetical protein GCM10007063_09650 [Lentibacillus kapialis]